ESLKADRMTQATNGHGHGGSGSKKRTFEVRILRQNGPDEPSYWERHRLELEPDMNVTSVLQRIAAKATTVDGEHVAPVAYDGYYDKGPGPKQSQAEQGVRYPLSQCMSCGCCLEACPQFGKIELTRWPGETDAQFAAREQQAFDRSFIGPHAISQVMYFNTHP